MRKLLVLSFVFVFLTLTNCFCPVAANSESGIYVPDQLSGWVEWVKEKHPEWNCARAGSEQICVWPGSVKYAISKQSLNFGVRVVLDRRGLVPLPFSQSFRPTNVTVTDLAGSNVAAQIIRSNQTLGVKLEPGQYKITGQVSFQEIPPEIPVPQEYGWVDVEFDKNLPAFTIVRNNSSIILQQPVLENKIDTVNLTVVRQLVDGLPLLLNTKIRLGVSGRARPMNLGRILPEKFVPIDASASLPYHLSAEGELALQLRGGEFEVNILSAAQQPADEFILAAPSQSEWPKEEVWSFKADAKFRSVEVNGGNSVQPEITQLPSEWHTGASYSFTPGSTVKLKELRRGELTPPPNAISLTREFWPNLKSNGYTVLDKFSGAFYRGTRINSLAENKLGRATIDDSPILITNDKESKLLGVEIRQTNLQLEAVSKVESSSKFSAVGWDQTVNRLKWRLNLPPLWRLIYVSGGQAPGSWFESWSLLHIFAGIVLVVATRLLFGNIVALLLVVALPLNHQEFLAPRMLFIHLVLLFGWKRLLGNDKSFWLTLCNSLVYVTFAALGLQALAFSKLQLTQLLFPQLESGTRFITALQFLISSLESSLIAWPLMLVVIAAVLLAVRFVQKSKGIPSLIGRLLLVFVLAAFALIPARIAIEVAFSVLNPVQMESSLQESDFEQYESVEKSYSRSISKPSSKLKMNLSGKDEEVAAQNVFSWSNKALQSGPALPTWHWKTQTILIDGPVEPSHKINLFVVGELGNRLFSGLRAILIMLALLLVGRVIFKGVKFPTAQVAAAFLLFIVPRCSQAEFPNATMLKDLESQLTSKMCDSDQCATILSSQLDLGNNKFELRMQVSADGPAAVTLPGPIDALAPQEVLVDDTETNALRRSASNFLQLRVSSGVHRVVARGKLPLVEAFSVKFPTEPVSIGVTASDWLVEGLQPAGTAPDGLRFTLRSNSKSASNLDVRQKKSELANWYYVTRELLISEQPKLFYTVRRLGSVRAATHFKLPLQPNERITSGDVNVDENNVLINFDAGQEQIHFKGVIPFSTELKLSSIPTPLLSEEWRVICSPIFSCSISGIQPTATTQSGQAASVFHPYSGENLLIAVTNLDGLAGASLTIDSATHEVHWGNPLIEASLVSKVRVTQPEAVTFTIPEKATLNSVVVDNISGGYTTEKSKISVLLNPGNHTLSATYQMPSENFVQNSAPPITYSHPLNNISIKLVPPNDRWLIWTGGGSWGPSVLFWSKLLIVIGICLMLQRFSLIPVSARGAVFLGIGVTTLPFLYMTPIFVWLVTLQWPGKLSRLLQPLPRAVRVSVVILLGLLSTYYFYRIVEIGLVLAPPMLVVGNQSSIYGLRWYFDYVNNSLPTPWFITLPLWCWRVFALAWATWLVIAMLDWSKRSVNLVRLVREK